MSQQSLKNFFFISCFEKKITLFTLKKKIKKFFFFFLQKNYKKNHK